MTKVIERKKAVSFFACDAVVVGVERGLHGGVSSSWNCQLDDVYLQRSACERERKNIVNRQTRTHQLCVPCNLETFHYLHLYTHGRISMGGGHRYTNTYGNLTY
uniref:Uncharacterized protein n=1 Tax=Glossina pallidipes TaxID=7398 RepID=A0A1A9ZJ69_GLOPL